MAGGNFFGALLCIFVLIGIAYGDCLGEFQMCTGGDCVMIGTDCGICGNGSYLCPDRTSCVVGAEGYLDCPNIKGTHFDWTLPIEERLDYLAAHTNISDQIASMSNWGPAIPYMNIPEYNWLNDDLHSVRLPHATVFPDGVGLGTTWSKTMIRLAARAIASEARAQHNELVHEGDRGNEQRVTGGKGITAYGPHINLVRDPRWGRAQEVYGEDPYLSSELAIQMVTGYQWGPPNPTVVNTSDQYYLIASCCKHYAAYDVESLPAPRYNFSATVNTRNMWETYLPVFKACTIGAGAAHVMCSNNAINGVPTCGSGPLMNGILREQWNWPGFIVSDYDSWAQIYSTHWYCPNITCASITGLNAGLDQEGGGTTAIDQLPGLLAAGEGNVTAARINESFKRLFRIRMLLGMLDPPTMVPYNYLKNDSWVEGTQHLQLARTVAQQSVAMFLNKNNVLPLNPSAYSKVAVIGPQAVQTDLLLGNYATYPDKGVATILSGIQAYVQNATCEYENNTAFDLTDAVNYPLDNIFECCSVCTADPVCNFWTFYQGVCYLLPTSAGKAASPGRISGAAAAGTRKVEWATGCPTVQCNTTDSFPEAVALAQTADLVIVCLGLDQNIEAEGLDRSTIVLPVNQYKLVEQLRQAIGPSVTMIAVFIHAGTFALQDLPTNLDGILDGWYPGQMGGLAIADVMFGLVSPGGRAAVTWYESDSYLPDFGNMDLYKNPGNPYGVTYRYFTGPPTIPFGHGMSYSSFKYTDLVFNATAIGPCDSFNATVTVTNVGDTSLWNKSADEVVQLYLTQLNTTVPAPNLRLAAFERITLLPGESQNVTLVVIPDFFSVVLDGDGGGDAIYYGVQQVQKGELSISVGGGQPQFFDGAVSGSVWVTSTANLTSCPGWV